MIRSALLLTITLAGCATVGPRYERPDLGLKDSDTFSSAMAPATMPTEADLRWWQGFDDPLLTQWVERALAGNLDVAVAFERVEQARALLRAAQADRGFTLDGSAQTGTSYRRSRGSTNRNTSPSTTGPNASAGLNLDWDADLWGGLQQAERSAAASLLRSQDLAQAARLATAALATRSYIAWREAQHEQALLQESLRVRQDTLRIVEVRVDAGLTSSLDLMRARADLASVQADLDDAAGRARQTELALQLLAGQRPTTSVVSSIPDQPPPIPQLNGTPSIPRPIDLLRLRPDVRAAERALIAAFADIGVAEAALYPQLRLSGDLLLSGSGIGTDTLVRTLTAGLSALLQAPLFDSGRRTAAVDSAHSRAREAALIYRQTVLEALEQVETALIADQTTHSQYQARRAAADASEMALRQARTLYTEGLTGFLDVLEAQRSWLENRQELMRTQANAARAAVATFEATGLIPVQNVATNVQVLKELTSPLKRTVASQENDPR